MLLIFWFVNSDIFEHTSMSLDAHHVLYNMYLLCVFLARHFAEGHH